MTIRFFHGDGPACEMEAGKQKNGKYPCWICPANFNSASNLSYVLGLPHQDLQDRMQHVMKTTCSKEKIKEGRTKLYSYLKKHEIIDELHQRDIKFSIDNNKDILEEKLKSEMHGIQRFPSLMQADPSMIFELKNYEILGCEPLHDIKGHIENLYMELPHHLPKSQKKLFEETIIASFEKKDCKRGVDYRKSLIKMNVALHGKIDKSVYMILSTLCEIQRILYIGEHERTMENILRLYNLTFLHTVLLKETVMTPKAVTSRTLWGKYIHALFVHAPVMYRIISGKSANAEMEERIFNTFKRITNATSNQHPDHILLNFMARVSVRQELQTNYELKECNAINKLCQYLPKIENTTIPFWIVDKFRMAWQHHLERIADFLYERCWMIESENGITFFDSIKNTKTLYKPHHFRSFTVKKEIAYVASYWDKCLSNTNLIPARVIITEEGDVSKQELNNIQFFNAIEEESMPTCQDPEDIIEHAPSIKEPIFPPYKPKKKCNTKNLVSVTQDEQNIKKISQEKEMSRKEITYSIKPVNEPSVPHTLNFKTKTANYIYKVIPNEEYLIKKYDDVRTKYKKNQNDINTQEDLAKLSAMLEIKLILN